MNNKQHLHEYHHSDVNEHEHEHHDSCGCEHEHEHHDSCTCEHEHEHHDSCTCEHEHEHHDSCGCEHEHEHHDSCTCEHEHEHHDSCGCEHEHEHHDSCTCEHEHEHHDSCGCEHEHEHHDSCDCEHNHELRSSRSHTHFEKKHHPLPEHPEHCECELCNSYVECCDICGESLANCTCHMPDDELEKRVYILEGLDCANCALKVEAKIRSMPEVGFATVSYATKQLRVSANNQDLLFPKMQAAIDSIEDGITLIPRKKKKISSISETKVYLLEGLDCANCAAKIEKKLQLLDEVDDVTITFATKQMKLSAKNPDELIPMIKNTIDTIENGITIIAKDSANKKDSTRSSLLEEPLVQVGSGAILFLLGLFLCQFKNYDLILGAVIHLSTIFFIIAYLILGKDVLTIAGKNLLKGQIFDENFLMALATLGAFGIREYPEAVGVMLFYRIGEYFEDRATETSRSQIMDAVDLRPEVVNLLVGEDVRIIDAEEAIIGDILLIRPGDRIPLDGIIINGESRIDTSPITGEPVPVLVQEGDTVTSGCLNTSGTLTMRVEKILEESMVSRILDSVENAAANKPNIDKFITKFARVYTPFVVIFALFVALVLPIFLPEWHYFVDANYTGTTDIIHGISGTPSIYTALTFLVISCPCALVLSVPLAFFSGIGAGSKKGILFKGGLSIEGLNKIKAVVVDKTGTITKGNFTVQNIVSYHPDITEDELLSYSASCELSSTHPIGNSIVIAAKDKHLSIEHPSKVEEIAGHGIIASLSVGKILCGNQKLMEKYQVDMSSYDKKHFGTEVFVAQNNTLLGSIVIADTLKPDAKDSIRSIKNLGIQTVMLTGDAQDSAENVAQETGIDEVHARLLPEDKYNELLKIREKYGPVMFVGDGINDAPVLAGADIGAAMGSGADAAIEAADVVLLNSEVNAIYESINIAKATNKISWQNVYFALAVKVIVMIAGLLGFANMWLAVFADTGVSVLCLINSIRILKINSNTP